MNELKCSNDFSGASESRLFLEKDRKRSKDTVAFLGFWHAAQMTLLLCWNFDSSDVLGYFK